LRASDLADDDDGEHGLLGTHVLQAALRHAR
jgi:hypothetical protein